MSRRRIRAALSITAAAVAVAGLLVPGQLGPGPKAAGPLELSVSGPVLVDGSGTPIRLVGVNRSGAEFACVQNGGIFDGPTDPVSIQAMTSWHVNAVRVPLNEDCWLGINGVAANAGGAAYQSAVKAYTDRLHQAGLYVILDLHWAAPGSTLASRQLPFADADHGPAFWSSVAATFRDDPAVVFDLYNEPYIDSGNADTSDPWACWRDGCTIRPGNGTNGSWQAAGMARLVAAVRSAGATQVLMLGGLGYASDLTGWLSHLPADPQNKVAASLHMYNFAGCNSSSCWTSQVGPVAASVPVVTGELGENDCSGGFIDQFMAWADSAQVSYFGWTWNTWPCGSGPALINGYDGTPTGFGAAYRDHLAVLAQQPRGVGTVLPTWRTVPHRR